MKLFLDLFQHSTVVLGKISLETARLDRFNELLEDLTNRALALLLQYIQKEHKFILALLAEFDFNAISLDTAHRLLLEGGHLVLLLFQLVHQSGDLSS